MPTPRGMFRILSVTCLLTRKALRLIINPRASARMRAARVTVEAHQMCTSIIESYTQENVLKLNQEKCEVLLVPRSENSKPPQIIYPIVSSVRILGSWFTSDLSSKTSIANNVKKAHSAFFANGKIGLLEGKPNPLTSREMLGSGTTASFACLGGSCRKNGTKVHGTVRDWEWFRT